jgi:N-acyl-D-amino-acid deacylase
MRFPLILLIAFCLTLLHATGQTTPRKSNTLIITNVLIADGTGSKAYTGSVRIRGNKIIAVGKLSPQKGEEVIDGDGQVLAPGFIDTHSHHLGHMDEYPDCPATNNQGITTIVVGQDGNSFPPDSIRAMLQQKPAAVNVATYTGQTTLREKVMGENDLLRKASSAEVEAMKKILHREMRQGSLGLSTGLEYEAAFYSDKDEVLQLATEAARFGGRYISHIRSEDVTLNEAITEIIDIGKRTGMPVQISHIKVSMKSKWGQSTDILRCLDSARRAGVNITADVYPYDFWNSTLRVLFPARNYSDRQAAAFATAELFDPAGSVLVAFAPQPEYENKTIAQIAASRNQDAAQTLMDLVAMASEFKKKNPGFEGTTEAIAARSMHEEDIANFIVWPHSNICSDGNAGGHPRGYGAFTRVLSTYVREQKKLPLEGAIRKMTALSAEHLGIRKRGRIAPGYYADLVLFNPQSVKDRAGLGNSHALSTGIDRVWINGELTYRNQLATGNRPGVFIARNE